MNDNPVRFLFTRDFDWLTRRCLVCQAVTVAFKRGHDLFVSREAADAAESAGAGKRVQADD